MNNRYIFNDVETVCKAVADHIVQLSKTAISKKGKFTIALSGGNTPRKLYEILARPSYADNINWQHVFIFWSDERFVPFTDPDNNSNMAFASLLAHVDIPAENIFPVPVNTEPAIAAATYEQTLKSFFKETIPSFDLILLGLGENGHTASLFPHTSILNEKKHIVKEVFVEEVNAWRISFTDILINNANDILFLVTGEAKASIIKTVFSGVKSPQQYPVQLINSTNASWWLDKAAASQLN